MDPPSKMVQFDEPCSPQNLHLKKISAPEMVIVIQLLHFVSPQGVAVARLSIGGFIMFLLVFNDVHTITID